MEGVFVSVNLVRVSLALSNLPLFWYDKAMFDRNTYIVLELPEPMSSTIHKIRAEQGDDFQASMPNEITVVGSSGVGPIAQDQDPEKLFKDLPILLFISKQDWHLWLEQQHSRHKGL